MEVSINGASEAITDAAMCLEDLVMGKGFVPGSIIVELNLRIIPREAWCSVILKEGDQIEVVRFVGGG